MTTEPEPNSTIKSFGTVVNSTKTVMELAKKIDNVELIEAIADLICS